MQVSERRVDAITVLDANGRMTRNEGFGFVKQRVSELLLDGHRQFVLNLTQVPYMDSTCVGELVSTFITVRNNGGILKLAGAMGRIKELLTIAKLDTVFEVYDTESEALESFSS